MAHHNTDIWRTTSPVGGSGLWAIYQVGGAWLCHHLWEHYLFTMDKNYLEGVYPYLKGAATFYSENLQENAACYLITSPSVSFENKFKKTDGTVGWACEGPTQDMQIIRNLFENTIRAATVLEKDHEFIAALKNKLKLLAPIKISPRTGRLQEWYHDWEALAPGNGQVAHGWGLAVGSQITPGGTPELAEAFEKTLEYRKPWEAYNAGSWVGSFSAMFWARLRKGEMLQTVLDRHFKNAIFPNLTSKFFEDYWQIDGNLGITASISEMLLQSHTDEIELLPALPSKYQEGEVKGLLARGGFIVDIKWEDAKLIQAKVYAKHDGICKLRYGNNAIEISMKSGEYKLFDYRLRIIK